jgi:MacB-like periplasmic core domain
MGDEAPRRAIAIVLTLALRVGANITVFSIADALLLKMLPVPEPERLVQILQPTPPSRSGTRSTSGDGFDDRFTFEQFREMQKLVATRAELLADAAPSTAEAVLDGVTETIRQSAVSGNYFRALAVNAVLGRAMEPGIDNEPGRHPQAVISYGFWKRRFGQDANVIGRTLQIGTTSFEIIGVLEPEFFGLQVGSVIDVWTNQYGDCPSPNRVSTMAHHRTIAA